MQFNFRNVSRAFTFFLFVGSSRIPWHSAAHCVDKIYIYSKNARLIWLWWLHPCMDEKAHTDDAIIGRLCKIFVRPHDNGAGDDDDIQAHELWAIQREEKDVMAIGFVVNVVVVFPLFSYFFFLNIITFHHMSILYFHMCSRGAVWGAMRNGSTIWKAHTACTACHKIYGNLAFGEVLSFIKYFLRQQDGSKETWKKSEQSLL